MMTAEMPITADSPTARHARLFELIRQKTLAEQVDTATTAAQAADVPQQRLQDFARAARASLTPQDQLALGISASFGR
ncbi:MAG: hypothetical protein R3D85_08000 [Paracoccaceae bacterium]